MKNKITSRIMAALMTLMMILQAAMPATTVFAQEDKGKEEINYQVKFIVTPKDAEITVKDGEDKKIEPSKEDKTVYELKKGSYKYSVSKEGYETINNETFEVDKEQDIKVDLVKIKADEKVENTVEEISETLTGDVEKETKVEGKIEAEVEKPILRLFRALALGNNLSTSGIKNYTLKFTDTTHDGASIEFKTQGESGYADYLNNPSKFTQPIGKGQKESSLSVNLNLTYKGSEAIKEGDTLEIPASLGEELAQASFGDKPLTDTSGKIIGSYSYSSGKFVLNFSGENINTGNVEEFSALLTTDSVKVANTTYGTGINGDKVPVYGKVLNSTIVAGYEKKNGNEPAGPGALSLDDVTIESFKIIDVTNGNKEIDYRTSDNPQYDEYKNDPSKFSNAISEGQNNSNIKLNLSISYSAVNAIKEGDTLVIPANYGGVLKDFASKPLLDSSKNQLGTCEYKSGNVVITFNGNYIKNNKVATFKASFETGQMLNYALSQPKTTNLGDRVSKEGMLGKNKLVTPFEKFFVKVNTINHTTFNMFKSAITSTDSYISWALMIRSDYGWINGQNETYMNSYMLEHNGEYSPKALTDIYMEDTFTDIASPPTLDQGIVWVTGIDDNGKIVSGMSSAISNLSMLKKIDQGSLSKEEVKNTLQKGEYSIYDNHDGTYTLMLKWWDTNSGNGLRYDDIPEISKAGGVGNFLKLKDPDIYGSFSDETIEKINQMYRGKSVQNIDIRVSSYYYPVKEITSVPNTGHFVSKQFTKNSTATGRLTPPAGIADALADPLSVKLIKSDRKTGAALSNGFKFELQTTTDNGTTWTKVNVDNSMMEKGTLNGDGTVTPDDKGIVQLKKLTVGKYRFFEKAHPAGYGEVKEDNANPNSTKYPKSANSKVIELDNQGTGAVVAMYNEPNAEKVEVKVNKKWEGPEKESVTVKLLADGKEVPGKTLTLNKAGGWEGKFTDLDKLNVNGGEIKYDVAEVNIDGYESKKTGDAKVGFTFTNKNTETVKVSVEKKWEGEKKDSVEIKLLADGNEVAGQTLTLNEGNDWKGEFINLAKYNKDGSEIKYSISEINIPFYKSTIAGDAQNGFIVTNKHVPPTKEVFRGSSTTNIDGKVVQPGEELTYAITYTNTTGKDVKAIIEDKIPNHTKFVSAENGGTEKDGVVTWNIDVAKDKSVTVKFKVKVNDDVNGKPIDNQAKVNDGINDHKTNETHNPTPTEPKKEVFIGGNTTNIDGKKVEPRQELTYAITYKNTTGKDVTATITDKVPAHTTFISADHNGKETNGVVKWRVDVAQGESVTVKFTVKVDKDVNGKTLVNKARVNDGENEYDTNETHNPTPKTPPTQPEKPDKPTPNNPPTLPKTGDTANTWMYLWALLTSGGLLTLIGFRRKKHAK